MARPDPQAICTGRPAFICRRDAIREKERLTVKPCRGWHNYKKMPPLREYRCPVCHQFHVAAETRH
jgi:hypothetical protein